VTVICGVEVIDSLNVQCQHVILTTSNKNSSGDEIANVNFFTTTSYNTSRYNPLLSIQHDAGRGATSGCGIVVLVRRFSHAPICCNEVRF